MNGVSFPWLEIAVLLPLVGLVWVARGQRPLEMRRRSVIVIALVFLCTCASWCNFSLWPADRGSDGIRPVNEVWRFDFFQIDDLSAPLLPVASLLFLLTALATLGDKVRRFSFTWTLVSLSLVMAILGTQHRWLIVLLMAIEPLIPLQELRTRQRSIRVFAAHMSFFAGLLVAGELLVELDVRWGTILLMAAVLIRSGIVPAHCWVTDLFERASFGTGLLFVGMFLGAYGAVRLVLPTASPEVMRALGVLSSVTAVYACGMALIQREARRLFCFLLLSQSALVLAGLQTLQPVGVAGGLCVWLSAALAMGGFGLTLRALEARHGRLSLIRHHGLYDHTPALAICFLITGLASVGFPGTIGFIGMEMLSTGTVESFPVVGILVVFAAALGSIAIVRAYFLLFCGTRHVSTVPLAIVWRERMAVLTLALVILGGGLFHPPIVRSRYHAAKHLIEKRSLIPIHVERTHKTPS